MHILGISAFYHDAAACLLRDGEVVAAAQEERFTRRKGTPDFPIQSIQYCLREGGIGIEELDHVVYYEKPWLHFERLVETYLSFAPRGSRSFLRAMSAWLGEKLHIRRITRRALGRDGPVLFAEHHESHMAAAFYPSPFERAAILTVDGVGEWATASWGCGEGNRISVGGELLFPHSLGLLYSAFTSYLGFKVNSDEYKVMGLAPYGEPTYVDKILQNLVDLRSDGSFRLEIGHFNYTHGLTMTGERFHRLFGGPPREPEGELTRRHMDIARSLQAVTEEIMLRMARHVHRETGMSRLVLGGGVALNCVANGRILKEGPFDDLWVQPAAGDAGGALGCALAVWHRHLGRPREADGRDDRQEGSYLGPAFDTGEVRAYLDGVGAPYRELEGSEIAKTAAEIIAAGKVLGMFHGRMEFGPRALGSRSILADARRASMQSTLNRKIKHRESFRPFAPAVLLRRLGDFFELDRPSPYMLLVAPVQAARRRQIPPEEEGVGLARLRVPRSDIPAATHVDGSARIQTVDGVHNRRFCDLLEAFEAITGIGCTINTSFNVRGEPIVCTPQDAYRCFMNTEMDYLLIEDLLLDKRDQPALSVGGDRCGKHAQDRKDAGEKQVDSRKPREFGLLMAGVLVVIALWGAWREDYHLGAARSVLFGAAAVLAAIGLFMPGLLRVPYRAWMALALLLSRITTPVLLTIFFAVVITPIGLLRRLFGADPMGLRRQPDGRSYWRGREEDGRGPERYTQRF